MILKAIVLNQREENKDAAELIHVVRYARILEHVAGLFIECIRSDQHPEAIDAGLAALANQFGDDDEVTESQHYAAGLIQSLLAEIDTQLAKAS
ncbi:TPA: hypothetical protein ACHB42_001344 [Yersinia enterocolitica]